MRQSKDCLFCMFLKQLFEFFKRTLYVYKSKHFETFQYDRYYKQSNA